MASNLPTELTGWLQHGLIHTALDILEIPAAGKQLAEENTPLPQFIPPNFARSLQDAFSRLLAYPEQDLPKSIAPDGLAALVLQLLDTCPPARQLVENRGQAHAEEVLQTRLRTLFDLKTAHSLHPSAYKSGWM